MLYEAATGKNRCDFPGLPDDLDRWPKSEREGLIELNEVLARACAPEAKKRHSNAAELAGDLNLILAGRSVRRAYRVERQLRRATWVSVAALVIGLGDNFLQLAATPAKGTLRCPRQAGSSFARRDTKVFGPCRSRGTGIATTTLHRAAGTGSRRRSTGEVGHRVRALDAVRRAGAISNSAALRGVAVAALALPDLRFEREWPSTPDTTLAVLTRRSNASLSATGVAQLKFVP